MLFILQFWYICAVALVKLSVLCFYSRLFSVDRTPLGVRVMQGLTICWLISFFFAALFQVWPIRCNWTPCHPTTNFPVMYMLSSVTNIILDVGILCLPISCVINLQVSRAKKIGIVAVFGLGILYVTKDTPRRLWLDAYSAQVVPSPPRRD